jgi:hypothetical protein
MRTVPGTIHKKTKASEQMMDVKDLIRRVESLMSDDRYPPLYIQRANLKVPSLIKHTCS